MTTVPPEIFHPETPPPNGITHPFANPSEYPHVFVCCTGCLELFLDSVSHLDLRLDENHPDKREYEPGGGLNRGTGSGKETLHHV